MYKAVEKLVKLSFFDVDLSETANSYATVKLTTTAGVFVPETGAEASEITFAGNLLILNSRLSTLKFALPDVSEKPTITVVGNDLGFSGAGGPMTDTKVFEVSRAIDFPVDYVRFQDSGIAIDVKFKGPTETTDDEEFTCDYVFDRDTVDTFGFNPICSFPEPTTLVINLGDGFTITPGDFLVTNDAALQLVPGEEWYDTDFPILSSPSASPG